ncbi:MAG: RHS repeat-associated core domain-containing protein, partial [Planctomycetaceae bacterium]
DNPTTPTANDGTQPGLQGTGTVNQYSPQRSYTGREPDAATGLIYYRARWFDPQLGRFISEDPIGFAAGDANLSRYVGNSTPNAVDPSGLDELSHLYPENSAITPEIPSYEQWLQSPSYHRGTVNSIADIPDDVWASYVERYGTYGVYLLDRAHRWGYSVVMEEDVWSSWTKVRKIHIDSDYGFVCDATSEASATATELYIRISSEDIKAPSTLQAGLAVGHGMTAGGGNNHSGLAQAAGMANELISEIEQEVAIEATASVGVTKAVAILSALVDKAKDAKRAARAANCATSGILSFVDELAVDSQTARRHLRRNTPGTGGQAHHIVPFDSRSHDLVQRAARGGFNMNGANNGIRLDLTQHLGSHPRYNAAITKKLNEILSAAPGISDSDAAKALQAYVEQLRAGLERSTSMLH